MAEWKPGKSGNPAGRKRKAFCLTEQIRFVLNKKCDSDQKRTNIQKIAEKLVELAKEGNLEAVKIIFDRIEGKVPQPIGLSGEDGGPIVCRWINEGIANSNGPV